MKSRRSKACDITQEVKKKVWERDNHACIVCGNPMAMPNAHFISRSHGGLGIEQNIVTLCANCHFRFDNTADRPLYWKYIKGYLQSKYEDWNEDDIQYKKF